MTNYARPTLAPALEAAISVLGGNAARIAILSNIVATPQSTPAQIAEAVGLSVATVRGHVKQLLDAGILIADPDPDLPFEERRGQWVRYSADQAEIAKALKALSDALTG